MQASRTAGAQEKGEKVWDSFRIHDEGISGMNEVVVDGERAKCHAKQTGPVPPNHPAVITVARKMMMNASET
jgi:hypothetical protein